MCTFALTTRDGSHGCCLVHDNATFFLTGRNPYQTKPATYSDNSMSVCILCNESSDDVTQVATCADKCEVYAHEKCFQNRRKTAMYRKKHHDRGNHDSEVCLSNGCCAKFIPRRTITSATRVASKGVGIGPTHKGADVDDPERPCSFMGNDGLPCRRAAVRNGACRAHSRNAELMLRMVKDIERDDLNKGTMTDSISGVCVEVQTEPWVDDTRSKRTESEVERNMQAVIHHYETKVRELNTEEVESLRRTNMELLAQMEELATRIRSLEGENATLVTSARESERREAEMRKRVDDTTRLLDRTKKNVRDRIKAIMNLVEA